MGQTQDNFNFGMSLVSRIKESRQILKKEDQKD